MKDFQGGITRSHTLYVGFFLDKHMEGGFRPLPMRICIHNFVTPQNMPQKDVMSFKFLLLNF